MSHEDGGASSHDGVCVLRDLGAHGLRDLHGVRGHMGSLVNGWGRLMIKGATPAGLFMGFVSIGVLQSVTAAGVVLFGVSHGMVTAGANVRTTAWYR